MRVRARRTWHRSAETVKIERSPVQIHVAVCTYDLRAICERLVEISLDNGEGKHLDKTCKSKTVHNSWK